MARSTGDRADRSLPRRPRFRLLQFRQARLVRPRPREVVQFAQAAQFLGVRPDHVMPVVVPPHVHPPHLAPTAGPCPG